MKKVLVTGANGFVGRHLCESLASIGYLVVGTTRALESSCSSAHYEMLTIDDIGAIIDWAPILEDVDVVVHLAARVHIMSEVAADPLTEFRRVNTWGSERLAQSAAAAGVKRLVYVSTIKVHGERTEDKPFLYSDEVEPGDPYGISKLEAEGLLQKIGRETGLEIVVLRPSLIYGPRVGGNFLRLLKLVSKGVFLPLAMIRNARSMLAISNLCDVIEISLEHPGVTGETFLVSDGEDVSTPELLRVIGQHMGRSARLFPVPTTILRLGGSIFRRANEVGRLCDSLQVDIEHTRHGLNWSPKTKLEEGIRVTTQWYQGVRQGNYD